MDSAETAPPFRGPPDICPLSVACSRIVSRLCASRSANELEMTTRAEVRFECRSRSGSRSNCDLLYTHGTVLIGRVWRLSDSIESLAQIGDQVRHVFNADRVPHKSVAITSSAPIRRRYAGVRHRCRVFDKRLHAAQ